MCSLIIRILFIPYTRGSQFFFLYPQRSMAQYCRFKFLFSYFGFLYLGLTTLTKIFTHHVFYENHKIYICTLTIEILHLVSYLEFCIFIDLTIFLIFMNFKFVLKKFKLFSIFTLTFVCAIIIKELGNLPFKYIIIIFLTILKYNCSK